MIKEAILSTARMRGCTSLAVLPHAAALHALVGQLRSERRPEPDRMLVLRWSADVGAGSGSGVQVIG